MPVFCETYGIPFYMFIVKCSAGPVDAYYIEFWFPEIGYIFFAILDAHNAKYTEFLLKLAIDIDHMF